MERILEFYSVLQKAGLKIFATGLDISMNNNDNHIHYLYQCSACRRSMKTHPNFLCRDDQQDRRPISPEPKTRGEDMVNVRDDGNVHAFPSVQERLSDCDATTCLIEAMRRHDPVLIEHATRTASYSLVLGRMLNLSDDDLTDLYHAALLHDLGKMTVPNAVIQQGGISIIGD